MNKKWASALIVSTLILIAINGVYYVTTRSTLIEDQKNKVDLIVKNVKTSIDTSKRAEGYYNEQLARELRLVSIAIQNELPPHIEDVTNEELTRLVKKYDLKGIDLWVKTQNDIEIKKSSDPKSLGLGSLNWEDKKWHLMFSQLLEKKEVDYIPGFGEKLKTFWSGPIDTRMVDKKSIDKWGYYYDGSTDYIINPYVNDSIVDSFLENGSVNISIHEMVNEIPSLVGVSVLNADALMKSNQKKKSFLYTDRMITYGLYKHRHESDRKHVKEAIKESKNITAVIDVKGKQILRTYIPTNYSSGHSIDGKLILLVSTDYKKIQEELNEKTRHILLISVLCCIIGIIFMYFFIRFIKKQENTILNVQAMYLKNIESLFKTVKEHRHDFNHHVFTILGLTNMKMYDELHDYVKKLSEIQKEFNDIIQVNIPAFSGLLQAKVSEAIEKNIVFEHHFENLEKIAIDITKTTDLVRIIGNILDNAFHAVEDLGKEAKKVTITGKYKEGILSFSIHNNGMLIPQDQLSKIFEYGYTTRVGRGGSGIGLASSQKIINSYKGTISVTSENEWTTFMIKIPISERELAQIPENKTGGMFAS